MKLTICGSSTFRNEMIEMKKALILSGHEVIISPSIEKVPVSRIKVENYLFEDGSNDVSREGGYIEWYYNTISNCDAVVVVNISKDGIKNYINDETLNEINFALVSDKKIYFFNPLPFGIKFIDQEKSQKNIVIINGDLKKII